MTRQEANEKILEKLAQIVADHPDLRFNQILRGLAINPDKDFYDESEVTLRDSDWTRYEA